MRAAICTCNLKVVPIMERERERESERENHVIALLSFQKAFIGQRYGQTCLQSSIPAEEFELLRMWLHNQKSRDIRTAPLLDEWYTKDYNSVPPVYFLKKTEQKISELTSVNL